MAGPAATGGKSGMECCKAIARESARHHLHDWHAGEFIDEMNLWTGAPMQA